MNPQYLNVCHFETNYQIVKHILTANANNLDYVSFEKKHGRFPLENVGNKYVALIVLEIEG